ncbi:SusC/RagA family TonB-linked outer membrane protein [Bacteroidia bacterium]|nr:SusC/RagA family TonB-linked outer membrane protein [Bacteroidia bacterium]
MVLPTNSFAEAKEHQQQVTTVKGTVTSMTGEPLIGVNIAIKGTTIGASSDLDGKYTINVPNGNAVLTFTYIGFEEQSYNIGNRSVIDVKMEESNTSLDEVVIVGYGTQKKVNLSGAVQAVGGEALASRPIPNVGSGLQGLVPNLNIKIGSGRADDAPYLNIRGFTSINDTNGEAFVLVDNMPVSREELSRLNPNDIASVSVLKDASSAAIYGARAAFGVVLITTKNAKNGKLQINFSGNYAVRDRGIAPGIETDVETVMKMKEDARYPLSKIFTPQQLDYGKQITANPNLDRIITDPSNPNAWQYYGSTDWFAETHNNTAASYTANLDISKKTEDLSYYVSGGYYQQDGLLKYGNDILNRYNIRTKVDAKLTKWWNLGANLAYTHIDYDSPTFLDGYFYWQVNRTSSLDMPRNPDGTWTKSGADLIGVINEGGRRKDRTNEAQVSFTTQMDIIKDVWKVNADVNFRRTNKGRDQENLAVKYRTGPNQPILQTFGERGGSGNSVNHISYYNWEDMYNVYNLYTNFTKTFAAKHFLNAMVGYNREFQQRYYYSSDKTGLITTTLPEINLSTGEASATNTRRELALEGVFGRLNYIYDSRYIFEVNGRYDGSSRFPAGDRYGFFPSASLAWSVVNEHFFETPADKLKITNLKFRGSYGSLGNQSLSDYYPAIPYMSGSKMGYILDGAQNLMMGQPGVVSPTLSWEKVRTANFGVDLGLFNKFNLNYDIYTRYTDDMLTLSKELPSVFGATPPRTNAADLKTKGWELTLGYRDRFIVNESPLNWSVSFMISDSRSKITKYDNPTNNFGKNGNSYYEGKDIGEIWGFTTDGYFKTQAEVDALNQRDIGTDDVGYVFQVGDIKMKDLDEDNKITFGDNTLANPGDRKVIGNTSVRYPYSFELAADYKGFDVRAFFQGVGKRDWYPGAASIYFWGVYAQPWTNVTKKNMDHWTPENPNAYFPRVKAYAAEDDNMELAAAQTKYLQDASYLRMKNLTIGYSIPKNILSKLNISYLRFYFSAENVFTISHLDKGIDLDPEIIDRYNGFNSGTYPMQRTYSIGANLTF